LVVAHGLSLVGPRGPVYRDVDLSLTPGGLAVVSGESGRGRTCLLLTLAGRMRPCSGTLTVAGRTRLSGIQRVAALGVTEGVNDLDDALSVAEHVAERLQLRAGPLNRRRTREAGTVAAVLAPVGLDLDPDTRAGDLRPSERRLLGAALALTDDPRLLVLDDVDRGLTADGQHVLWERLRGLTETTGVTIIASCVDAGPAAGLADLEVTL
jgi:ABC-2 type transport system ATP-binding protein